MQLTNVNIKEGTLIKDIYAPEYGQFRVVKKQAGTDFWVIENRSGKKLLDPGDFQRYEVVK